MELGWTVWETGCSGRWMASESQVSPFDTLPGDPKLEIWAKTRRGDGVEKDYLEVDIASLLDELLGCHRGRRLVLGALLRAESADDAEIERRFLKALNEQRDERGFQRAGSPYSVPDEE